MSIPSFSYIRFFFAILVLASTGCGGLFPGDGEDATVVAKGDEDYAETDKSTTPEEREYIEAGRPFLEAIANEQFGVAYGMLSSHAKARMSLNQFIAPDDEAEAARNEKEPLADVSAEDFLQLMRGVVSKYGSPTKPISLYVQETDPEILSGKVKNREDQIDVVFAIGAMPQSVPADIRRASLRGQIQTKLTPEDIAKEYDMTAAEVEADGEFTPYFTVKYVLVEEQDELKVGYFVFLPSSMFD